MGKLTARLQDAARSGVYRTSAARPVEEAARPPVVLTPIVLSAARDKDGLLKAMASCLAFPGWFGGNWDALEDCLADLSWLGSSGHVLLIQEFQGIGGDDLGILADVLASSAEAWAARGRPFFAVFVDPSRRLAWPDLFQEK